MSTKLQASHIILTYSYNIKLNYSFIILLLPILLSIYLFYTVIYGRSWRYHDPYLLYYDAGAISYSLCNAVYTLELNVHVHHDSIALMDLLAHWRLFEFAMIMKFWGIKIHHGLINFDALSLRDYCATNPRYIKHNYSKTFLWNRFIIKTKARLITVVLIVLSITKSFLTIET